MNSVVSEKGQVTIPKRLRDQLGLRNGTVLEFHAEKGTLVARKAAKEDPLEKWAGKGKLPFAGSVDDYIDTIRGR